MADRASKNREIRREAVREQIQALKQMQLLIETCEQLHREYKTLTPSNINALKASADIRLAILRKVLPDVKAIEVAGENGDPVSVRITNA